MVNDRIPPLAKNILGRIDAECDGFFFPFCPRGYRTLIFLAFECFFIHSQI